MKRITHLTLFAITSLTATATAQTVKMPDPNLKAAVLQELGRSDGEITQADLLSLKQVIASRANIRSIEGLEHALNLEHLDLSGNELHSVWLPDGMSQLKTLNLANNLFIDYYGYTDGTFTVRFPESMPMLETLDLSGNGLTVLPLPQTLPNLRSLNLSHNRGLSLHWPAGMTALEDLNLESLGSSRLDLPEDATALKSLNIREDYAHWQFDDLERYGELNRLVVGRLSDESRLSLLPALQALTQLQELEMDSSGVNKADLESLSQLKSLTLSGRDALVILPATPSIKRLTIINSNRWGESIQLPDSYNQLEELRLENVSLLRMGLPDSLPNCRNVIINNCQINHLAFPESLPLIAHLRIEIRDSLTTLSLPQAMPLLETACLRLPGFDLDRLELPSTLHRLRELAIVATLVDALELPGGLNELQSLTLDLGETMKDLKFEGSYPALHTLTLSGVNGTELTFGSGLENLKTLGISSNAVASVEIPPSVESLELSVSHWKDLSGLSGGENLRAFSLQGNALETVDVSDALANVKDFRLTIPATLPDIQFLSGLPRLTTLHLGIPTQSITYTLPDGLAQLETLTIHRHWTRPDSFSKIALPNGLTQLRRLEVELVEVEDFSFLNDLINLEHLILTHQERSGSLEIPASLSRLQSLDLRWHQLDALSLPNGLSNLRAIQLFNNGLTTLEIPQGLTQLVTLELENNWNLQTLSLPDDLESLVSLDLSDCGVTELALPEGMDQLAILRFQHPRGFDDAAVGKVTLPNQLPNLTFLDLSVAALESLELPNQLPRLQHLIVDRNRLTELTLPDNAEHLATISAIGNRLSTISVASDWQALRNLNLRDNQLAELSIPAQATLLEHLDLSGNRLKTFDVPQVNNLQEIRLANNFLSTLELPENLSELTTLDASNNGLTSLEIPGGLHQLQALWVQNNRLTSLTFAEPFPPLESLHLSSNRLTDVSFLSGLSQLQTLSLNANRLAEWTLPSGLEALRILDISSNGSSQLTILEPLPSLLNLSARGNELREFSFLHQMPNLSFLDLDANEIDTFEITEALPSLGWLGLANNEIENLSFLRFTPNLRFLNLTNNGISKIRLPEGSIPPIQNLILDRNSVEDLSFLRDLPRLKSLGLVNTGSQIYLPSGLTELFVIHLHGAQEIYMTRGMLTRWRQGALTLNDGSQFGRAVRYFVYSPHLDIVDIQRFPNLDVELTLIGVETRAVVQSTEDLVNWSTFETVFPRNNGNTPITVRHRIADNQRYFRVESTITQVSRPAR